MNHLRAIVWGAMLAGLVYAGMMVIFNPPVYSLYRPIPVYVDGGTAAD